MPVKSGIRGWWDRGLAMWRIRGLTSDSDMVMDRADAEALHRATPEDPGEAKAVADVLGQVAVVALLSSELKPGPLLSAINELARLQQAAINERARVARQQPKEGKDT